MARTMSEERFRFIAGPIPVAGPDFRFYILPKLFVDGNLFGMYLFGYGNFVSTRTPSASIWEAFRSARRLSVGVAAGCQQ